MSSSPSTVYLVTGCNRGIGLGLAASLEELSTKYHGRIAIVKCLSADAEGNTQLAQEIQGRHGRVDTVIANAAVARVETTVLETPAKELEEHFTVNVVGTAVLFQALHVLLKASASPRFVPISTASASIGGPMMPLPMRVAAYGASKAALNYITRKIHFENEWLVAFPLAPGVVNTDSAKAAIANDTTGVLDALQENFTLQTPEDAAKALIDLIDEATREKEGGEFVEVRGE